MNDEKQIKTKLTGWEQFWYYASVVCTWGVAFTLKVIIKKAFEEK